MDVAALVLLHSVAVTAADSLAMAEAEVVMEHLKDLGIGAEQAQADMPARVLIMPEVILQPTIHQQDQALAQHLVITQVPLVFLQAVASAYLEKVRMVLEVLVISVAAVDLAVRQV